jgi:Mg2+/Co2+ transporter CorB
MPVLNQRRTESPKLDRAARTRISEMMQKVYFPPDTTPISDEQLNLLLELRRKERERGQVP